MLELPGWTTQRTKRNLPVQVQADQCGWNGKRRCGLWTALGTMAGALALLDFCIALVLGYAGPTLRNCFACLTKQSHRCASKAAKPHVVDTHPALHCHARGFVDCTSNQLCRHPDELARVRRLTVLDCSHSTCVRRTFAGACLRCMS